MDSHAAHAAVIERWRREIQPRRVTLVDADRLNLGKSFEQATPVVPGLPSEFAPGVATAGLADFDGRSAVDFLVVDARGRSEAAVADLAVRVRKAARFSACIVEDSAAALLAPVSRVLGLHAAGDETALLLRGGDEADAFDEAPRVWYLAPNRQIFGGVKILYQHVAILRTLGISAVLGTEDGLNWPAQWFPWNPAELCFGTNARTAVRSCDTVVIPEFRYRDAEHYAHAARRLLFVQNPGLIRGLADWRALGYDGILTLGRPDGVTSFLEEDLDRRGCQLPMFAVPNHFDDDPWGRALGVRIPGRILCLPRKGPEFVARIVAEFGADVECLDNAHQVEMAAAYARADVYVHTGFPEGLGMPIVEAMLSGCVACGFAGGGGLDVLSDGKTGFLATDGDMDELLKSVRRALASPMREGVREAGRRAARRFTRQAAAQALDVCYRSWLPNLPRPKPSAWDRMRSRMRRAADLVRPKYPA
jgi:hypothetical protein